MVAILFAPIVIFGYLYISKTLQAKLITIIAMKSNFRTIVMKYAWQLYKTTGQIWRICLIKAWQLYKLAKEMRAGVVEFYYQKADGSVRKAKGTFKGITAGATLGKKKSPTYKTLAYFDTDKNAFRCFKVENFICVV